MQKNHQDRAWFDTVIVKIKWCRFLTHIVNCVTWKGGALVHIYTDGSVLLTHGGVEMGQGLHTKMVQVITCLNLS